MNSPLVSYTKISPNKTINRTQKIDRITPHCVVGQLSAKGICECFTSPSRGASCNYAIGYDGEIALCVEEKDRSWCSSSAANDQRAVTIECASDKTAPYAMNSLVYESLIKLCTDICKRNGKSKLIWFGNKEKTLAYKPKEDEMIITVHRWFANKSCPGDWLYSRLGELAEKVTKNLAGDTKPVKKSVEEVAKEVIAGRWGNGSARKTALVNAGYNYQEVQSKVNELQNGKKVTSEYYQKYTGTSMKIDTVLKNIGVPSAYIGSYKKRVPLATANGISNYTGTLTQNSTLILLAKQGKLKKV